LDHFGYTGIKGNIDYRMALQPKFISNQNGSFLKEFQLSPPLYSLLRVNSSAQHHGGKKGTI